MKEFEKLLWVLIWLLGISLIFTGLVGVYKSISENINVLIDSISSIIVGAIASMIGAYYHDKI